MTTAENSTWKSSDAWLLQSTWMAAGEKRAPVSLRSIIATGDYINHAVFSFDELQGGLGKLAAAGFLEMEKDSYRLSSRFYTALAKAGKLPKSVMKQLDFMEKLLGKTVCPGAPVPGMISREQYDAVCAAYLAN